MEYQSFTFSIVFLCSVWFLTESRSELSKNRPATARNSGHETRLVHYLFDGYNKLVRPVKDNEKAVPVFLGVALTQIVDLEEKNQILVTSVWLRLRWTNSFLTWNTSQFGGVNSINIEPKLLWVPDIQLYNSASGDLSESFNTRVILKSSGENVWFIPVILRSRCKIDIEYFPFDEQHCPLRFGSWTYHGLELDFNLAQDEADLAQYQPNGEFELVSARAIRNVEIYSCCEEPYINLIYTIHFRRKMLFYLNNLVVPCILITVASLFTFILPPNTGERVTLVITTLLSLTVFMLMIAENTPNNSEVTPMIAKFFIASMLEIGLALVVTCLILNIYHSTRYRTALPHFIRVLVIDVVAPLLLIPTGKTKSKKKTKSLPVSTNGTREERYLLTNHLPAERNQINGQVHHELLDSPSHVLYRRSSDHRHDNTIVEDTEHSECDYQQLMVHHNGFSSKAIENIARNLDYLTQRERERENSEAILDEWEIVAKVADRFFLIIFIFTITCSSFLIFAQTPATHQQPTTS